MPAPAAHLGVFAGQPGQTIARASVVGRARRAIGLRWASSRASAASCRGRASALITMVAATGCRLFASAATSCGCCSAGAAFSGFRLAPAGCAALAGSAVRRGAGVAILVRAAVLLRADVAAMAGRIAVIAARSQRRETKHDCDSELCHTASET